MEKKQREEFDCADPLRIFPSLLYIYALFYKLSKIDHYKVQNI